MLEDEISLNIQIQTGLLYRTMSWILALKSVFIAKTEEQFVFLKTILT